MTPEEKARILIDKMFADAGWMVVDRDHYAPNISAVAIKEGLLEGNMEADYFLFINGKAVGVLEAKRQEVDITADKVKEQAEHYVRGVPDIYQAYMRPLPIVYLSNGKEVLFCDYRQKDNKDYKALNRIHTPKEIVKLLGIEDIYAGLPILQEKGLRRCQYDAITELETSFRNGQNRALMVLATGAGKTYAACLAAYRFLAYTPMKRILFLVDRNNLGKQAEAEFGMFKLTENGDAFNLIYTVNRLHTTKIPSDSNVVISTIQRLFSLLKGDEIEDEIEDEENYECDDSKEIELPTNLNLPHDYFDLIIIDECHRSIYKSWKGVLNYFNTAKMIGLTATPIPETVAFFNNNIVINYTLNQSILDGINVDGRIYRIKTQVTEDGGAILEGEKIKRKTLYTGQTEVISNKEMLNYTPEELNRSIINPSQIKLILETYRDVVYTEMFVDPQRENNMDYLPKTLIFALNETHASNIVKIGKEVFGRKDDKFIQKITYSAGDSNELIRQFRNDKEFRIAVTCTLVATGTDIKPLEVLIFMRDVNSETLYVQMKGRGVRTIGDEQLRNVTPNALSKDCYFLVDAVGVTEHEMGISLPVEGPSSISLQKLLELITHGNVEDYNLNLLASRLSRIYNKSKKDEKKIFEEIAHIGMNEIAEAIFSALDNQLLPPYDDVNKENRERKALVNALANNPKARDYLLLLNAGYVNILQPGEDTLISKGFSVDEAQDTVAAFERYCNDNKDKIEALSILYNNTGMPITYSMLKDLENKLKMTNNQLTSKRLWNSYALVNPDNVRRYTTKEESEALTNIIQLVRFAFHQIIRLDSVVTTAKQYFNLWLGQNQRQITEKQREVISRVVDYIASNGACTVTELREDDATHAAQMIDAFDTRQQADEALQSLYKFVILRKSA